MTASKITIVARMECFLGWVFYLGVGVGFGGFFCFLFVSFFFNFFFQLIYFVNYTQIQVTFRVGSVAKPAIMKSQKSKQIALGKPYVFVSYSL